MTVVSIEDFGATPDGALCTENIQEAIDRAAQDGGVVLIPTGTFFTGTVQLRSGVTLRLDKGAVLKGSSDLADYRDLGVIHNEWGSVRTLIYADHAQNVSIEGEGTIDFNGSSFFDFTRPHSSSLDISNFTEAQLQEFEVHTDGRPNQAIFLSGCQGVTVRDVRLVDSPCWGLCVSSCDDVRLADLTLRFSRRIPNADGIHLSACRNAIVTGCDIVAGDDGIAVTCIGDWTRQSSNIVISSCIIESSSAAIRVGYWHSRVRDVQISNCIIRDSVRGVVVMSCGSGLVENVTVSGVSIQTRSLAGTWWGMGEGIYVSALAHDVHNSEGTVIDPVARDVNIRDLTFRDVSLDAEMGIVMIADQHNAQSVRFFNTLVELHDSPNRTFFGDRLDLKPGAMKRSIPADSSYWLYAEQIDSLLLADTRVGSRLTGTVHVARAETVDCDGIEWRGTEERHLTSA